MRVVPVGLALVAALAVACGSDSTSDEGVSSSGEPGSNQAAAGDESASDGDESTSDGGEQVAADPGPDEEQGPGAELTEPDIAEPAPDIPTDGRSDRDEPPTTIKPPAGYEPLCEMGLAMWPLTSTFEVAEDGDAAGVAALYGDLAALLYEFLPRIPAGQIADDTRTLADGVAVVAEVVGEYQGPFGEVMVQAEDDERLAFLFDGTNEFNAAGERWDETLEVNCGLHL
jgi:hypothetical protein